MRSLFAHKMVEVTRESKKNRIMRNIIDVTLKYERDLVRDDIGETCSMYGIVRNI